MCILCGGTKITQNKAGKKRSSSRRGSEEVSDEPETLCKCFDVSRCEHCHRDLSTDHSSEVSWF